MSKKALRNGIVLGLLFWGLIIGAIAPAFSQVVSGQVGTFRNILIGGDFSTNPFQAGTTALAAINTTATFAADRWALYANVAGASAAAVRTSTASTLSGFTQAMAVQRTAANANTQKICMVQQVTTANTIALQSQPVVFSVYALAGANFSAALSQVSLEIITGTGTDQGLASLLAATWTGQANTLVSLQTIGTTFGRVSASVVVPSTATEMAVQICSTPVGTAGAADTFQFTGAQLEIGVNGVPTQSQVPTAFERRSREVELVLAQAYRYVLTDAAATIAFPSACWVTTANTTVQCRVFFPVEMRAAPTVTVSVAASFGIILTAGTAGTCTGLVSTASSFSTKAGGVTCTTGGTTALGTASPLIGAATAGTLVFNAEAL